MKNKLLILFLALTTFSLHSQDTADYSSLVPADKKSYIDYDWVKKPKYVACAENMKSESDFFIFFRQVYEIEVSNSEYKDDETYLVVHSIIQLNDDKSIENYNKIYLPGSKARDLIDIKCRVINPSGVIEMNDEDIKEQEEDGYVNRYFAVRGLEKGSILEYFYVKKNGSPRYYGNRFFTQFRSPILHGHFALIHPSHLEYEYKKFNNCDVAIENTSGSKKSTISSHYYNIKALKDEKYASAAAYRDYIIFKINKNKNNPTAKFEVYKLFSKRYFELFGDGEMQKGEKKAVAKFLKLKFIDAELPLEERVKKLENAIKENYFSGQVERKENKTSIAKIGKEKVLSQEEMFRFFCESMNQLGIEWELVVTADRDDYFFDKDFETTIFLDNVYLYVKGLSALLDPSNNFNRVGFANAGCTNTYGLFIKKAEIGGVESGAGKVKFIPSPKFKETNDELSITVTPDFENQVVKMDIQNEVTGYNALMGQLAYEYMSGEMKKEIRESRIKALYKNAQIDSVSIENAEASKFGIEPLKTSCEISDKTMIENAGRKYLLKVGELIGPQQALYSEKVDGRVCDVNAEYPHTFFRKITVNIPEGYDAKNLDSLQIKKEIMNGTEKVLYFESYYKLENNKVVVYCKEGYKNATYPKEMWGDFLQVINASADFNKLVIVFEPKK